MIRRLAGALLMGTMLQLTALDVRAECERHAEVAREQAPVAGHEHHAAHVADAAPAESPGERAPVRGAGSGPAPKCCMVAGTCTSAAFASIVLADELGVATDGDASAVAARQPASPVRAPDTPPPKG